ncbi:hypothetical protein AQ619_16250 [Caulobacter henricii]|uniref:Uncharacterized protein n=1 Tax=Caulobacter henricii TaxID=69395 RepID=A0A0P0P3G9_9CAUL|nr:hypothetical protein AQ619_16250 [Caulobacter henricii]
MVQFQARTLRPERASALRPWAPSNEAEATCAVARRVMEGAATPAVAMSVPLTVEARAALSWDEAH